MDSSLLSLFLPSGLLSHFEITDLKEIEHLQTKKNCFYIYLEEKNALPEGYDSSAYESKGFYMTVFNTAANSLSLSFINYFKFLQQ
ncbi:hypothetical protein ACE193_23875 [Bernardetia sp. OM2101]|uniref:hypothetical protein n=1 Tax=Bernardetia sp. OM2101 TaxID=3344876 RepID=UPI0035D12884